jgi:hypothetical protein
MVPLVPGAEHYREIAGKLREVGLRKGRSDALITEFARDSLLEEPVTSEPVSANQIPC